ncbi:oxidoreductase [Hyphococcus luteus]|uniref:Probable oxidoreductase n=1 Tax=Hyphococcus luteus TaxID=2058213 RepID=A0A2S7JYZ3_9PROT|nr:oxidoreductase [Marinicaulis flavus]PQA85474.1 oxidoreductase [Marinicaulis flavus]
MPAENQIPLKTGFGPHTAASEVMEGVDLAGKTAVVTGGYSGIGLEVVKALSAAGAEVIVPARNKSRADEALASNGLAAAAVDMDLADLTSVYECAAEIGDAHNAIHFLFNNAGIMACPEARVGPGWEKQFAVNHLGHFVLARELMPYLLNAGGARMVTTSSVAHKRSKIHWDDVNFEKEPYDKWVAYGQSKTANALFALEVNNRRSGEGVKSFSVHPGPILTPIMRHITKEELVLMGWLTEDGEVSEEAKGYIKTPDQGAASLLWAATSPLLDDRGGEYCEDCDIAAMSTPEEPRWRNVAEWAVDDAGAERLWELSEAMILSAQA